MSFRPFRENQFGNGFRENGTYAGALPGIELGFPLDVRFRESRIGCFARLRTFFNRGKLSEWGRK